jgi:hypothetical protein
VNKDEVQEWMRHDEEQEVTGKVTQYIVWVMTETTTRSEIMKGHRNLLIEWVTVGRGDEGLFRPHILTRGTTWAPAKVILLFRRSPDLTEQISSHRFTWFWILVWIWYFNLKPHWTFFVI